jgi:hypothetical protein
MLNNERYAVNAVGLTNMSTAPAICARFCLESL